MHATRRNTLLIVLFLVVFGSMFVFEAMQAIGHSPHPATSEIMRPGLSPRW